MEGVISSTISNSWKAFGANKMFLKSKMKTEIKIRILQSYVIPVLELRHGLWCENKLNSLKTLKIRC